MESTLLPEDAVMAMFKPSATYPEPFTQERLAQYSLTTATLFALRSHKPVLITGKGGIGKTSNIRQLAKMMKVTFVYINMALFKAEGAGVPMPKPSSIIGPDGKPKTYLEFMLRGGFASDDDKIIVFDEFSRATKQGAAVTMEVLTRGTIHGVKIKGLQGILALQNPVGAGYSVTANMDLAVASRFVSVEVGYNDTPWREALACVFPENDLTKFFTYWETLPMPVKDILNGRTLEYMLKVASEGLPVIYSLPAPTTERVRLFIGGDDRTEEILQKLCETAHLPYVLPAEDGSDMRKVYEAAIRNCWNVSIIGAPGTGKTSILTDWIEDEDDLNLVYWSGSTMTAHDMCAIMPNTAEDGTVTLESIQWERVANSDRKVIVVDEYRRMQDRVAAGMMEAVQEHSIDGVPIENLAAFFAIDNPRRMLAGKDADGKDVYFDFNVGRMDPAQAGRFHVTLIEAINLEDNYAHLAKLYPDVASPFIEWHRYDLDDLGRVFVNPRVLELMMMLHSLHTPPEYGLPKLEGKVVPVNMAALRVRILGNAPASFITIVEDVDTWVEYLKDPDRHGLEKEAVNQALENASLDELKSHRDAVAALLAQLDSVSRANKVTSCLNKERMDWFLAAMPTPKRKKPAAK